MCYSKTQEDVQINVKAFAAMPEPQGKIYLTSNSRGIVFTFICRVLDKHSTSIDPETIAFLRDMNVQEVKMCQHYVTHSKVNRAVAVELIRPINYCANKKGQN